MPRPACPSSSRSRRTPTSGRSWGVTRTTSLFMTERLMGFQNLPSWLSRAMTSPLRCGRLAFHIQLPFSFLHFPYVESAIRYSHVKDFCGNCSLYPNTTQEPNSTMEVPATPSSLPEHDGMESETLIHQHKPLHPHHHHEVSNERDTNPSEDHKPATHAHHHHGDHGELHHKGKKHKEGDED
ncbi:hypothetical protein IHE44_0015033 [Lamprotornis superbus]|uniref:Selenoprotein P N-terminal domain-containing protein n=1 Tax=Lamprotornis superbus TaxID=245042 RepID=A0A835TWS9_9PASS|nr:hypothetical protein IHE44_0015033 [Lamprotornis superbus]